jgi:hypothetical protein
MIDLSTRLAGIDTMKTKAISILSDLVNAACGKAGWKPAPTLLATLLLASATLPAAAQTARASVVSDVTGTNDVPWSVAERGPHSRVWQRVLSHPGPNGKPVQRVHRYTELQTGLHYQRDGKWVESRETIAATADGAAATNGPIQVHWLANLNSAGAVDVTTPDRKRLRSNILGIGFADATGKSVLIGETKDSYGQLLPSGKEAMYPDAFTDLHADVLYKYGKGSFEQFVIFREQLPSPAEWGLDPASTMLQVWTEFLDAPTPRISPVPSEAGPDQLIDFGAMQMVEGDAFALGSETNRIAVRKEWVRTPDGRVALVEQVPLQSLLPLLQKLPAGEAGSASLHSPARPPSAFRLPPRRLARNSAVGMKLASAAPPALGVVDDYDLVTSQSNLVFQADMTYYINSTVGLTGSGTFEGGTVIKFCTNSQLRILYSGTVVFDGSFYRPIVVTAQDDDTVGEILPFSTGSPVGYYAGRALLLFGGPPPPISHLRISYAKWGIQYVGSGSSTLSDVQFLNCGETFVGAINLTLHNGLFANNGTNFVLNGGLLTLAAENCTFSGSTWLATSLGANSTLAFTNCILANVTNLPGGGVLSGGYNAFYGVPAFGSPATQLGVYPFQTVGAGDYYLSAAAALYLHQAGTTNIDASLLADLAQTTTYPPIVYANQTLSASTTLSPQAQRNTGIPDLGYHYDALDYVFGACDLYTNLTFTAGTSVGWYEDYGNVSLSGQPYSLSLNDGATLTTLGTATQPCWLPRTMTVQEGVNGHWQNNGWMGGFVLNGSGAQPLPQINDHFGRWSTLATDGNDFLDDWASGIFSASDSEFYSGSTGGFQSPQYFTNCLFFRMGLFFWDQDSAPAITFQNCTFYNGFLALCRYSWQAPPGLWDIENCAFDGTGFGGQDDFNGTNLYTTFGHNAYNTNNLSWQTYPYPYPPQYGTLEAFELEVPGPTDQLVGGFNWESGPLGNFYQPSNSPTVNAGSKGANLVGLYHFTVMTNLLNGLEIKETNSIVDIGYHYVATDAYGNPIDTAGAGFPDYIADANGNGIVDPGERSWLDYYNGILPVLTIAGGNNQVGFPNSFLLMPLVVEVSSTTGAILTNAPLVYSGSVGGAQVAPSIGGIPVGSLSLRTDSNGQAAVSAYLPAGFGTPSYVNATATSGANNTSVSFSENNMQGPALWLQGDPGTVNFNYDTDNTHIIGWKDRSGNNNNATIRNHGTDYEPILVNALNGHSAVYFNGNYQYFDFPNYGFMSSFTQADIFGMIRATTASPSHNRCVWSMGGSTGTQYPNQDIALGSIIDDFGVPNSASQGPPAADITQYHLYNALANTSEWASRLDGRILYTMVNTSVSFPNYNHPPELGEGPAGNFDGDIAEVLLFNRVLTPMERDGVGAYLNQKYQWITSAPAAPSALTGSAIGSNQVSLQWTSTLGSIGIAFDLERSDSGGNYAQIAQVRDATSFVDTNVLPNTTYSYRLRAANYAGLSGYCSPLPLTTPSSGVGVPLGNLVLWLQADSGVALNSNTYPLAPVTVGEWIDQSGANNNATPGPARLPAQWIDGVQNGRPALYFNQSPYYFLPNILNNQVQAEGIVVLKATADPSDSALWRMGTSDMRTYYPGAAPLTNINGVVEDDFGMSSVATIGCPPASLITSFHVYDVFAQLLSWEARFNGELWYSQQIPTPSFPVYPITSYPIIGNDGLGEFFGGNIAEIMIFNSVLTPDQRDAVGQYLQSKYAFMVAAPTPGGIQATGVAPYQINISWPNGAIASDLGFERKAGLNGSYQQIAWVHDTNSFLDASAVPGTNYFYRVRSWNYAGYSAYSSEVSVPAIVLTNPPPQTFYTNGASVSVGASVASAVASISKVDFYVNGLLANTVTSNPYTTTVGPLGVGVYSVVVKATDSAGNSAYSYPVNFVISPDTDGDGVSDYQEVLLGTDPTNPLDYWTPPPPNPNDHTPPVIYLYEPADATPLQ